MAEDVFLEAALKGVLNGRLIHYFCRLDPLTVGVRFLTAKFRQRRFPLGDVHASDLELAWCRRRDEEWVIMSVAPIHEAIVQGELQRIRLRCMSGAPFLVPGLNRWTEVRTIGYAPGHWLHPARPKDKFIRLNRQALQEEEDEVYIKMFQKEA